MELTLEQALQEGIAAHKAGKVQEADQYYSAILKAQPKHPDANHNMGVLAVGIGKVQEALPFFKKAIEANANIAQFWLSYIDALIKLNQLEKAKDVLAKAKRNGATGDRFDQIEEKLLIENQNGKQNSTNNLIDNAVSLREMGRLDEAINLLKLGKADTSNDANLFAVLAHCHFLKEEYEDARIALSRAKKIDPNIAAVSWNEIRLLLKDKNVSGALAAAKQASKRFPKDVEGMAILGSCFRASGDLDQSLKYLNKAIEFNCNYSEALVNRGLIYLNQKDNRKALEDIEAAYKIKPHLKQIWDLLIKLKIEANEYSQAISILENIINIEPSNEKNLISLAFCNHHLGNNERAIKIYENVISINPNSAEAYNNLGVILSQQGNLRQALDAFNKLTALKPDSAEAHNNVAQILYEDGKLDEAIKVLNKALAINPSYPSALNNLGNVYKAQKNATGAIKAYRRVIEIKPDYADAYNNMGFAMKSLGRLDEAMAAYNTAIKIKPDFAEAYNNRGIALVAQGKIKEAVKSYSTALKISSDFSDPYWNLSGTVDKITDAKEWLKRCLKTDPMHGNAKLTMSALNFYEGNKDEFFNLVQSPYKEHPYVRSFSWAFNLPKLPPLYFHRWALFDAMIEHSKKDRPFYEFGVWRGEAFKYLIKTFKTGYGFDTFQGLPEDWHEEKAGTYTSDGNIPKVKGGEFIVGKFEDTLPEFFQEKRPKASIINFDADLYSSTICALNYAKPVIDQHTILIFDEFIINDKWEEDEYKALEEFCANNRYTYEVLALSFFTKQVAVKIIGI